MAPPAGESSGAPGTPGSATGPGGSPAPGPGGTVAAAACSDKDPVQVPEVRIRRLSRVEYDNTLRDLGLVPADAHIAVDGFAGDGVVAGARRGFSIGGTVDASVARDLVAAATKVAAAAAQDVGKLAGCTPATAADENACARAFITSFGRRAYRRPLAPAEVDELFQVFTTARPGFDFRTGIETVLASMLAAPEFVYLIEKGPAGARPGAVVPVDGLALASRLSYFLWDSTPDAQLLTDAQSGALASAAQVEAAARRLLADPRAHGAVNRLIREWSFIDDPGAPKDPSKFSWYTPDVATALKSSFVAALEGAFWGATPTLASFLGGDTMFANAAIGKAYGMPQVTGTKLIEIKVDPGQRRGPLTHPAFLALQAKPSVGDPIHRGLFVRRQMLCTHLPDPPDKDPDGNPINFAVAPPSPGVSNRERFREHTANPVCAGCHTMIDPIGFGFENYDAAGRYRTVDENGNPIDASGAVQAGGDLDGPFTGALALVDRAVKSQAVAACMTVQAFRFGLGREESPGDECSNARVTRRLLEAGGNLREMIVALAASDAFRYRRVGAGEGGTP